MEIVTRGIYRQDNTHQAADHVETKREKVRMKITNACLHFVIKRARTNLYINHSLKKMRKVRLHHIQHCYR